MNTNKNHRLYLSNIFVLSLLIFFTEFSEAQLFCKNINFSQTFEKQKQDDAFYIPTLKSDEDRMKIMHMIKNEFPAFLNNGTGYGFDTFEVIEEQERLVNELNKESNYKKMIEQRPPYMDITIKEKDIKKNIEKKMSLDQLSRWRENLLKTYLSIKSTNNILSELTDTLFNLNRKTSEGELIGFIKKLTGDLKVKAFQQPGYEEKMNFLKNSSEISIENKKQLSEIENIFILEQHSMQLIEIAILLQSEPGHWVENLNADQKIKNLTESDYQNMLDFNEYLKPRFESINIYLKKIKNDLSIKITVLDAINRNLQNRLTVADISTTVIAKREVHLLELRPAAGVFRACAGGDCSTKFSFAAPNNPDELIFHLTNANGETKGYVEATRVKVNKKDSLYVSSINGPRISAEDAELILAGLYKLRNELKVEQLVLPQLQQIGSLMNYEPVKDKIKMLIKEKPEVSIEYLNPIIREKIEKFQSVYMTMPYDSMSHNNRGVLYEPTANITENLETLTQTKHLEPLSLNHVLSKSDFISFIVESKLIGENNFAERASEALKLTGNDFLEHRKLVDKIIDRNLIHSDHKIRQKAFQFLIQNIPLDQLSLHFVEKALVLTIPGVELWVQTQSGKIFELIEHDYRHDQSLKKTQEKYKHILDQLWTSTIEHGDLKEIEKIIGSGLIDINQKNRSGFSILQMAVYNNHMDLVDWLIRNPKFDFTAKNQFGLTELEQLAQNGKSNWVQKIIKMRHDLIEPSILAKVRNQDGSPIIQFVNIESGFFNKGDANKIATVINHSFSIFSIPTTQKIWSDIIYLGHVYLQNEVVGRIVLKRNTSPEKGDELPVTYVNYHEVDKWLLILNSLSSKNDENLQNQLKLLFPGHKLNDIYRIPTDDEWEFVARLRGLSNEIYPFEGGGERLSDYAWYAKNSQNAPNVVGQKNPILIAGKPIYDLFGNAYTWVSYKMGDSNIQVLRGGSYKDSELNLKSGFRKQNIFAGSDTGFRLIRNIQN